MLLSAALALAAHRPVPQRLDAGSPGTTSLEPLNYSDEFRHNAPATVPVDRNDVALLTNILWTRDEEWETIKGNWQTVKPRFSSIAIDMFDRPNGETPEQARALVMQKHGDVVALFDRVNFFSTGNKSGIDKHVKSSVTYRRHWQAVLGDTDPVATSGAFGGLHGEGLPELFMQVDSRYTIPQSAVAQFSTITKTLRASVAARAANPHQQAARLAAAKHWKSMWLDRTANLPCNWGNPRNESALSAAQRVEAGTCAVSLETQHPVFIAPLDQMLARDLPLFKDISCDECAGISSTPGAFGGVQEFSVRFPYCPSSQKLIFHRSDLPLYMQMLSGWREAFDAHYPSGDEYGIYRMEVVACGLLSKFEKVVYAFY